MRPIASVGILVADVVAKPVSHYPERGVCAHVERMELHVGGCASNTGLALAKLGLPVRIVGKVGRDPFGDFLLAELNRYGADTRGVRRSDTAGTSSTMVMVHPDGERSFIHYRGANAEFTPDDIDWSVIGDCAVFHLAGVYLMPQMDGEPAARVLQEAKRRGMTTCLDTTWDASGQWMRLLQPCLPHLDYITPNYGEASMLTGETDPERIADRLLAEGVGTAVIKMDAQGCFVKNRSRLPPARLHGRGGGHAGRGRLLHGGLAGGRLDGLGFAPRGASGKRRGRVVCLRARRNYRRAPACRNPAVYGTAVS